MEPPSLLLSSLFLVTVFCANDKAATKPIAASSVTHFCRIEKNYFLKMQTICNGCKLSIRAVMKVKLDQNCP